MLNKLVIKNVALIENAEINFTQGFNVLSGETGAGKSVILESINFVLGAKADKSLIRNGENECMVSAEFDVLDNNNVYVILDELGFDREDLLIITRKFDLNGKNSVKINGNSATVSMVKKLTSALLDVHGQSEHFYLLSTANQLKLIDRFAALKDSAEYGAIQVIYKEYKDLIKELESIGGDEAARLLRLDVLNYQIKEIESAAVRENEFEELTDIKSKLLHREKIITALNSVKSSVEDEGGLSDILSNCIRALNGIVSFGEDYAVLSDRLNNAYSEIDDIVSTVNSALDGFGYSEYSLEEIDDRLNLIKTLFRKYGGDYAAMTEFYEGVKLEKEKLENYNDTAEKLQAEIKSRKQNLYDLYIKLSDIRKIAAEKFAKNVLAELVELGMPKASFYVDFSDVPTYEESKFDSANGFDEIKFMFSANLGEPVKPLSDVISGGEMSRFMLAIKAQTAKYNEISTFIFDEIDAGISGVIAWTVAEKLVNISRSVQVIAVSHLPQIVSFADNNILIIKTELSDKTVTTVKTLTDSDKVNEIARLSGGTFGEDSSIDHAKSLIQKANEYKSKN